jgi:polysaccharide chain length determinant protein (PEP-CTERM system associated)
MNGVIEQVRVGLHVVWRRRWLAIAVAWAIALVGWLAISLVPNVFESHAKVFVQPQSILPQAVGISSNDQQQTIDDVRQNLLSSDTLQSVVKQTVLARNATTPRDMANAVDRLARAITIKSTQDNLFDISADFSGGGLSDSQNAHLAQDVVQRLVDAFVAGSVAGDHAEAQRSLKFMDAQLAERGQQLQVADQKRTAFEQKYLGLLPGSGSIENRLDTARSQLADVDSNLAAAQSSMSALSGQLAGTPPTIPGVAAGGAPVGARATMSNLQAQLAQDQAQGFTDQHPDVIALKSQIARLSGAAAAEPASGGAGSQPNPMYMSLKSMVADKQATVAALSTRHAQLQADINTFQSKQSAQPEVASEQAQLSRDYDVLKAAYDKLLSDREGVKLRADAQSSDGSVQIRVIEAPGLARIPSKPSRPLLLTGVLLVALAGGAAVAFLRAKLQTSFSTPAALAAASGLPVLGAISFVRGDRQKAQETQQLKWFAGTGGALVGAWLILLALVFVERGLMA